jgi:D-glycero-alpha-D-manno-heptose 1-phosphate guanylyltransferase
VDQLLKSEMADVEEAGVSGAVRLSDLTAVVLAGGLGTRLRPVLADRPKFLAPVGDRAIGARVLDTLADAGLGRAVLCTGYLADQVAAHFGRRYRSIDLRYSPEPSPIGTGGALRAALPLVESDPVLVLNGDSVCGLDYTDLWAWYRPRAGSAIVVAPVADVGAFGGVRLGPDDRVEGFVEKGGAGPGLVNAGVYLLERARLASIPADRPVSLEREMFPAWVAEGLRGYRAESGFLDVGTPERLTLAERAFQPSMSGQP